MKSLLTLSFIILLSSISPANSQMLPAGDPADFGGSAGMTVGDHLPNIEIGHVIRYSKNNLKLSELKGKLVIFDFFLTNCGSCISALPHLDSIQREFKCQIQVFIVTTESTEKVGQFFSRNWIARRVQIPIIVQDSILNKLFWHTLIPHEVWVGPKGKVEAITDAESVTSKNIKEILSGKTINLRLKYDFKDDGQRPLMWNVFKQNKQNLRAYSYFGNFEPGLAGKISLAARNDDSTTAILETNVTLNELFSIAYLQSPIYPNYKIIREYRDSLKYIPNYSTEENLYCYELMIRGPIAKSLVYKHMQVDLQNYFGLTARRQNMRIRYLILKQAPTKDKSKLKESVSETHFVQRNGKIIFKAFSVADIIFTLQNTFSIPVVIIDETKYTKLIDLEITISNFQNLELLNRELNQCGLEAEETDRLTDVLILKDI